MTATYVGTDHVELNDWIFDPERGPMDVRRIRGTPSYVYGEADALKNLGWDVTTARDGPYVNLRAQRHRPDPAYAFVERWSLETEIIEKPIWTLPKVETEANLFSVAGCAYREDIETALRDGKGLHGGFLGTVEANQVLNELIRGVRAYEHENLKLTRRYAFNFQSGPPVNLSLETDRKLVYTKDQLDALLNIPAGVMFQLPTDTQDAPTNDFYDRADNPAPNNYTAFWGWRLREQSADLSNGTTGVHEISFIHAQWSMFAYRRSTL